MSFSRQALPSLAIAFELLCRERAVVRKVLINNLYSALCRLVGVGRQRKGNTPAGFSMPPDAFRLVGTLN